jgi:hypothetical protein
MKAMTIRCWVATVCVMCSGACHRDDGPTPAFVPPSDQNALHKPERKAPPPPPPAEPPADKPSPEPRGYPKAGWSKEVVTDGSQLCAFANELDWDKAGAVQDVGAQSLKANEPILFGAYAPHCVNFACDDKPSLQCWLEQDGKTITVHSRYWAEHKDGATCSDNCLKVKANCKTEPLAPGTYTVKHGERSTKVRIPSTLKKPCGF